MKKINIAVIGLLQILLFSSCLTTSQTNLLREPGGSIPAYPKVKGVEEYSIKPGDELMVSISVPVGSDKTGILYSLFSPQNLQPSGNEAMKLRTLAVTPEGTIYFPYIGDISVAGKTTLEVRKDLEEKINTKMLTDDGCVVMVRLENRFFSVIGESSVGRYPIAKEQMTIFQALAQSRDIFPYGDRSKVRIIRQTAHGTIERTFDLRSADVVNSEYYYIQPNDVIYIQPLNRQFWGIDSFGAIFAVVSTVASLGILIYNLTK